MNDALKERLGLFSSNAQEIKKDFVLQNSITKRLAALIYASENKRVDCAAIRECYELIKKNTGIFSVFRGNMAVCIATMLSLLDNRERRLMDTITVYDIMKDAKFKASDFLAVAAFQIAVNAEKSKYASVVDRAKAFYDGMKENHMFYTGKDDYIFAAMLGISDINVKDGVDRMERLHKRLKPELGLGNSVQALTQVLVLGGETDESADGILRLRDLLRDKKIKLDREYTLSSLGLLSLLQADAGTVASDISESYDFLREQKGFGTFSVTKQELLLFTAAIVASAYVDDVKSGVLATAISTSVVNIIIAQQAAVIAATAAYTTVAASAASSN